MSSRGWRRRTKTPSRHSGSRATARRKRKRKTPKEPRRNSPCSRSKSGSPRIRGSLLTQQAEVPKQKVLPIGEPARGRKPTAFPTRLGSTIHTGRIEVGPGKKCFFHKVAKQGFWTIQEGQGSEGLDLLSVGLPILQPTVRIGVGTILQYAETEAGAKDAQSFQFAVECLREWREVRKAWP